MDDAATPLYPADPWAVRETRFELRQARHSESVFALGNGYLGMRGTFEEGLSGGPRVSTRGTYLNGFYESGPIRYPEDAYGLARKDQTLTNVTDGQRIELLVEGERFAMDAGRLEDYARTLDLRRGVLRRELTWLSPGGRRVRLEIERLVCLTRPSVAAIRYRVTAPDGALRLELRTCLDGRVADHADPGDPRAGGAAAGRVLETVAASVHGEDVAITQRTRESGLTLACAASHRLTGGQEVARDAVPDEEAPGVRFGLRLAPGGSAVLEKTVAYVDSRAVEAGALAGLASTAAAEASALGFETLAREQAAELDAFWQDCDVIVEGDDVVQQSLRFGLLQLYQGVGRDGRASIAAKGLTGPGYQGHLFWDAELYVLPSFLYARPELARGMLLHRIRALDAARRRAAELRHAGALYPWRTIDGDEASAFFPAGTAQVHINADIAYALERYLEATGDSELLWQGGAAMLFETARFWLSRGTFVARRGGAFCLHTVTGPDEYTALVDNNFYTNLMAQEHLRFAARTAAELARAEPARFASLAAELHLDDAEPVRWLGAADRMRLPFDPELGIHCQDDGFLDKEVWDPAGIAPEERPLLLHFHPLDIYRRQVLKQPDVVQALYLREERFSRAEARRDFAYYEPLTTHDSSLSPCVHGIVAARLGQLDKAERYFRQTARMDLDDINRNVKDGVHTAAMGGAVMTVLHGFAGMRTEAGRLSFVPRLPGAWDGYRFRVALGGCRVEVAVRRDETRYRLLQGASMTLLHRLEPVTLTAGESVTRGNAPRLRAVLFDLDGVLTDTAEFHYRAWQELADRLGVPFDRAANESLRGVGRMASLERILERAERSYDDTEKARLADEKNRRYQQLIETITPADLLPGVPELLAALREAGLKVAVASASRNAPAVVRRLAIEEYVDVVVDAAEVRRGKPDPEVFSSAAEQLGVLDEDCLGIEDAEAGVAAILAAGMAAVGVGGTERVGAAHRVVADTGALDLAVLQGAFARAHAGADGGR